MNKSDSYEVMSKKGRQFFSGKKYRGDIVSCLAAPGDANLVTPLKLSQSVLQGWYMKKNDFWLFLQQVCSAR